MHCSENKGGHYIKKFWAVRLDETRSSDDARGEGWGEEFRAVLDLIFMIRRISKIKKFCYNDYK